MSDLKSYPGFWQSVLLLVYVVLIQIVLLIPIILVNISLEIDLITHPATLGLLNLISIGLVIWIGKYISKKPYNELFPLKGVNPVQLLTVLVTTLGVSIVLSDIETFIRILIPIPDIVEKIFMDLINSQTGIWGSIFTVVLVAAFSEEFLFRGLILNGYVNRYGKLKAIIFTALLFGFFHMNPWQLVGAMALGAVYAWWFILTGNLTLCIIGHGLNNLLPIIIVRYFPIQGYSADLTVPPEFQPFWLNIIGIVLTIWGIWLTIKYFKPDSTSAKV